MDFHRCSYKDMHHIQVRSQIFQIGDVYYEHSEDTSNLAIVNNGQRRMEEKKIRSFASF